MPEPYSLFILCVTCNWLTMQVATSNGDKMVPVTSENVTEKQEVNKTSSEDSPIYDILAPAPPPPPAPPVFIPAAPSAPPLPGIGCKFEYG